jgi:hypothetical protein
MEKTAALQDEIHHDYGQIVLPPQADGSVGGVPAGKGWMGNGADDPVGVP